MDVTYHCIGPLWLIGFNTADFCLLLYQIWPMSNQYVFWPSIWRGHHIYIPNQFWVLTIIGKQWEQERVHKACWELKPPPKGSAILVWGSFCTLAINISFHRLYDTVSLTYTLIIDWRIRHSFSLVSFFNWFNSSSAIPLWILPLAKSYR